MEEFPHVREWPKCFGRYDTCAKAEVALKRQMPTGALAWRLAWEPEVSAECPWALYAHNLYHERRADG